MIFVVDSKSRVVALRIKDLRLKCEKVRVLFTGARNTGESVGDFGFMR